MKEAAHDFDTDSVNFRFECDGQTMAAIISMEALSDHFGGGERPEALIAAYRANSVRIDAKAREIYKRTGQQPVRLKTADF